MKTNVLISISALLVHVAKIDENYTAKEQEIIKKFINSFEIPTLNNKGREKASVS